MSEKMSNFILLWNSENQNNPKRDNSYSKFLLIKYGVCETGLEYVHRSRYLHTFKAIEAAQDVALNLYGLYSNLSRPRYVYVPRYMHLPQLPEHTYAHVNKRLFQRLNIVRLFRFSYFMLDWLEVNESTTSPESMPPKILQCLLA